MIADSSGDVERYCVIDSLHLLILCGHKQIALENAALRQQLAVFKRKVPRTKLNNRDRFFWIGLRMSWRDWKSALMIVQPETVTSWHRMRFRRYWWFLWDGLGIAQRFPFRTPGFIRAGQEYSGWLNQKQQPSII